VDRLMLDYGQPTQSELGTITVAEAARHLAEGQFPPGSMGPKVQAAIRFLADDEEGDGKGAGELAVITSPDLLAATLTGAGERSGTRIERSPAHAERSPAHAERSPAHAEPSR
jgi:carbamate kinase